MKMCNRHRGAISVFLLLILLPTLVFGGLVTDAARIYGSETLISEAGELSMNAGLSRYDSELKDDYGLMVMEEKPEDMKDDLEQYFVNTIRASDLDGASEVSSLIDLKCKDFYIYNVEGSQIYLTEVEKQQILEYMKYRAPVCIGEELWDMLNQIKESRKETDAMSAQMDFSESMENLQEACESANNALKKYCKDAEEDPVITAISINSAIDTARECYERGETYLFMLDTIRRYPDEGQREESQEYLETMEHFNSFAKDLSAYSEGTLEEHFAYYLNCLSCKLGIPDNIEAYVEEKKAAAGSEEEKQIITECYEKYVENQSVMTSYVEALEKKAKDEFTAGQIAVGYWYTAVDQASTDAKEVLEALDAVKEKIGTQRTKYQDWTDKTAELSDGDLKSNMEKDAEGYDDLLDEEALENLYTHMSENEEHLDNALEHLKQTTFCNQSLAEEMNDDVINVFKNENARWNCFPDSVTSASRDAESWAASVISAKFVESKIPDSELLFKVKDDPFYKELQQNCQTQPETEESKKYKNTTKSMLDQANISGTDGGIEELKDAKWQDVTLPTAILAQSGDTGDENNKYIMAGGGTDRSGRKKAIANAKACLSATSSFLEDLEELLEDGIENLYLMEYGMQMFSYYTVDKDENGVQITGEITSISDDDLTDNALYKSEVEYMLWGNKNAQQNVKNTRLLLYGVRMVFNMLYTFSNKEIAALSGGMAIVMSCGIPFLVPVFNVVIKVAVAGVETVFDVEELMAGKRVPLLKNALNSQAGAMLGLSPPSGVAANTGVGYKDYLSVFLLVKTFGKNEALTLARIADCIQLNVEKDIIEGYTMLAVGATVESRTTFMKKAAQLPEGGSGSVVDDWYNITYQSILGY